MTPNRIVVVQGDITTLPVDAIVNAANSTLLGGGGVDGAIHAAAGPGLLAECRTLGGCPVGEARLTGGYDLPAGHVIHTVGPVWHGGTHGEPAALARCYQRCLAMAVQEGLKTIAFPAISTGAYGYPTQLAAAVATGEIYRFLCTDTHLEQVLLVGFGDQAALLLRQALRETIQSARRERFFGGMVGAVVADALGVPVEFTKREARKADPVTGVRGYGTYNQPPGSFSDDSSLLLCSAASLAARGGFDPVDQGAHFVGYLDRAEWTPHGKVFDIGGTTANAINALRAGLAPERCGGAEERDNGNGSLMRILPIALHFAGLPPRELCRLAHRASSLTHAHPRSLMACGIYCLIAARVLEGAPPREAYRRGIEDAHAVYQAPPFGDELPHFARVFSGGIDELPEDSVQSGGYVIHTLEAALWCWLRAEGYDDAVLRAINLGGDTDTTACVTGGLAGLSHGLAAIPAAWRAALARQADIVALGEALWTARRARFGDWSTRPMPAQRARLEVPGTLGRAQYEELAKGRIPHEMEDKWFVFADGDWVYLHRSWTGLCVYQVRLAPAGDDYIIAEAYLNQDPAQHRERPEESVPTLQALLGVMSLAEWRARR